MAATKGRLQQEILDMLARGCSVEEAGNHICAHAEQVTEGVLCSLVTVDRDGRLHPLAGPTIAKDYSNALDGIAIGPGVGSCGTAAFLGREIAVENIFTDPYWLPYRALADILAEEHEVKACWSSPILQSDGRVLGAFGFYYKENRGPTEDERMIVAECVALCSLVLEREEVKAENQRLAYFDVLTGLGNRANFIKTLEITLAGADTSFGILLIDLDHLGRINDAFGHAIGDRLILEAANAISQTVGSEKTFRVDADEFAVRSREMQRIYHLSVGTSCVPWSNARCKRAITRFASRQAAAARSAPPPRYPMFLPTFSTPISRFIMPSEPPVADSSSIARSLPARWPNVFAFCRPSRARSPRDVSRRIISRSSGSTRRRLSGWKRFAVCEPQREKSFLLACLRMRCRTHPLATS